MDPADFIDLHVYLIQKDFFNISFNEKSGAGFTLLSHNIGSSIAGTQAAKMVLLSINISRHPMLPGMVAQCAQHSIYQRFHYSTLQYHPKEWSQSMAYILHITRSGDRSMNSAAKGNGATWADVLYQRDTIRIYNVHLVSNRIYQARQRISWRIIQTYGTEIHGKE